MKILNILSSIMLLDIAFAANILSSSELEDCSSQRGLDTELDCEQKVVLLLSVRSQDVSFLVLNLIEHLFQLFGDDAINVVLKDVTDKETGQIKNLETPIQVQISKD